MFLLAERRFGYDVALQMAAWLKWNVDSSISSRASTDLR